MTPLLVVLGVMAFGFATGTLSGVVGVGGGIFVVPFLVLALGVEQQQAQATSLVMILPTAIVAVLTLRRRGVGDFRMTLRIGLIGAAGSLLGAALALQLPGAVLRSLFAVVLAVVGARLLWDGISLRRAQVTDTDLASKT